jgi:hypothetical protein
MSSYLLISLVLDKPERGLFTNTPSSKQDWKRFFGMMDTLERNEIATFQNGRYLLHPKRKANVVVQAEAVLAEISKPLTLDEPVVAPVVIAESALPQFNACETCKGKGRVNIQDALGFFGSFMCLTCYGEGQLPVPSRSTFPPVDLSVKPSSPNTLLFSSDANIAPIPLALEVGGVHVIVEAPPAAAPQSNSDCDTCQGYGTLVINNIEQTCTVCNGTGEKPETPVVDSPSSELIATLAPLAAIALGDDDVEVPALVAAACSTCTGSGMSFDTLSEAPYIRVRACDDCGGTGELQELPLLDMFPDSPSDELITPILSIPAPSAIEAAEAIVEVIVPVIAPETDSEDEQARIQATIASLAKLEADSDSETRSAIKKERFIVRNYAAGSQFVRVNWTGRGMSSGKFELHQIIRQYGQTWYVVKMETDKVYLKPVLPGRCELVVNTELEMVVG